MGKEQFMIEEITKELVLLLIDEQGKNMHDALRTVYTSDTFAKLCDLKTGLYTQSTAYIYEYLETELKTGKLS
ncbi:MAG: hypothetical protein IJ328_07750 [Muribaculaceae bacterium]|nr:hypothetical protein [Muribaculaceae bacterium]